MADPDAFPTAPGGTLGVDDQLLHPFRASEAVRHVINAAIDQLHGIKTTVVDAQVIHLGVSATLARGALENAATGLWLIGPADRTERLKRVLRWHAQDYYDRNAYVVEAGTRNPQRAARFAEHSRILQEVVSRNGCAPLPSGGVKITEPLRGCADDTEVLVMQKWMIASGFAHGRPWAHQGFLDHQLISENERLPIYTYAPRRDVTQDLPLAALALLEDLLRLRETRASPASEEPGLST
ncbi:hypothetical protein [Tsukamurella sp. TY48]|uniref:hypothetical protein n=1 Tax=Tsukamurella TaxID=2060 RepID=UPI001C7DD767|nr:hypothetical protein [Tsukamurella sp. TY48]